MMHADSLAPVAVRREQAQQRIAANRAAVAVAWADVGEATVALEAKAHRAVDWTRTLSAIAAVIGGLVALRRMVTRAPVGPGMVTRARAGPALRAMAAATVLRRALPSALRLYLRRPLREN